MSKDCKISANDSQADLVSPDQASPLISIVIPAFNRETELFRCITSILASTYRNYEIIVINNSADPSLIEAVQTRFPLVRTIDLAKNTGILAFNIGFANAQGDYIMGIDDDCGLRPNTLEEIVKAFASLPPEVGAISAALFNPLYDIWVMRSTPEHPLSDLCIFADGATVFRREVFKKVGYYYDAFFCWQHGPDLSIRMLDAGYRICLGNEVIIDHYEKRIGFRPVRAFYDFRNLAWLNIKNFSLRFFPLLIARNLVSFCVLPFHQKHALAALYGLWGYVAGWLTFLVPLRDRSVPSLDVQRKFIRFFVFNKLPDE